MPQKKIEVSNEQMLEIGAIMHRKDVPIDEITKRFEISRSRVYEAQRFYREANGIPLPVVAPKKKSKVNGAVPLSSLAGGSELQRLRDENATLRQDLERAMEEAETLQKIVMTLGKNL